MSEEKSSTAMSLGEHFRDLRKSIFSSLLGVIVGAGVSYYFWQEIWKFLKSPITRQGIDIAWQSLSPIEVFANSLKVSIVAGIIISSPWTLWNMWKFLAPALFDKEKNLLIPVLFFSMLLFLGGASFCFFIVLPYGMKFFAGYSPQDISTNWQMGAYTTFTMKILIAFGLSFELPIFSFVGTRLGFLTWKMLLSFFRYAVLIIFLLAAFLTPPDPITQILLAIPLILIYGISILISKIFAPKEED